MQFVMSTNGPHMRLSPRKSGRPATIAALYGAIVAQARLPVFYTDFGVADTAEGRLEMILLHLSLLARRLPARADGAGLGQDLFSMFCQDMDDNLREMGVSDLAVPKRIKAIVEAYLGRSQAYDDALSRGDRRALAAALLRNVYGGETGLAADAERLGRYGEQAADGLAALPDAALLRGDVVFGDPAIMLNRAPARES